MRKITVFCVLGTLLLRCAFAAINPVPPNINTNNVFVVTNSPFNAVGDGNTVNTAAIQSAINAAALASGGGTVEIPGPGIYLTGPLTMKSKVNFQIDAGATVRLLPFGTYPGQTYFFAGTNLTDLEISGSGGIDGQGSNWWVNAQGSSPYLIYHAGCNRVLIEDITISNAPAQDIVFKNSGTGNILIQGIKIFNPSSHASAPSHNTDGIDLVGTNNLVQNCVISTGDDNIAIGSSSEVSANILVTNCLFGVGHGMTIGSNTEGGVSNLTVINCTFTNTDYGIKMKSDNASSGGSGQGGLVQNLAYFNLGMTNLRYGAILIFSYYNDPTYGGANPTGITPSIAAGQAIPSSIPTTTVLWRSITISNLTATVANGNGSQAGMIWGRTEMPVTNITLTKVSINATGTFNFFNVKALQIVDSSIDVTPGKTYTLYNARFAVTNSTGNASGVTFDGLASTNSIELDKAPASMGDGTLFGANPISLNASILTNTTTLTLQAGNVMNFALGTNTTKVAVTGNLNLTNTLNISDGGGFAPGVYTLFTYTGTFSGTPGPGSTPPGYNYNLTNGSGKVNLVVTSTCVNPTANVSGGGTICSGNSANIQAALTGTQPWSVTWSDGLVQSGVTTSPAMRTVSPTSNTNYTVTALSDSTGCPAGTLSGVASVTVNGHPTATVSGGGTVCGGNSVNIQAALTGTQPWSVTWSDGTVQSGVTTNPATRSVSPPFSTNYTVTALSDATGCGAGALSGSASVTVCTPLPFQINSIEFANSDQVVLTWSAVNGNIYQVLSKGDLTNGSWVTNATITASGTSASWTNSGVSGVMQRFYRVVNIP
jgi:polygalacturonase